MVLGLQNEYPTSTSTTGSMFDSNETVTLTKAQLSAILEAVGQVGGLRISEESTKPPSNVGSSSSDQDFYSVQENLHTTQLNNNNKRPVDENINGFPFTDTSDMVSGSRLSVSSSQNASVSSGRPSPISMLQQKRLQWERERAEADSWNPWGRPGGGAPRKTKRSVVMATVSPSTAGGSMNKPTRGYSSCSYLTSASLPLSTSYGQRVPDFLKSSLPFGPNSDEVDDSEQLEKKRQWISELDSQREEQRRLRQSSETFDEDHWVFEDNDRGKQIESRSGQDSGMNTPLSVVTSMSRSHHRGQTSVDPDRASKLQEQRMRAEEYRRLIEEQVQEKRRQQEEERERLRLEEEREERRLEEERERLRIQYELEQRQVKEKEEKEEQRQRMMAAAVLKAREEAEAEKKAKKAQRLNCQNAKSPKATPTHQAHPHSKHSSKDEPITISKSEEHMVPQGIVASNPSPRNPDQREAEHQQKQQTAAVRPMPSTSTSEVTTADPQEENYNDDSPPKSKSVCEISSQTDQHQKLPPEPSAYVVNRLLTPSVWRTQERKIAAQNAWGHHRDMFTQTETPYFWDDHTMPAGPSSEQGLYYGDNRSSRNSSATSGKRSCVGTKSEAGVKPVWGANQPVKSFVKMTDRDPNHSRHKRFQEMRRQHWEREMATLREQMAQARARSRATGTPTAGVSGTAKSAANKFSSVTSRQPRGRAAGESAFQVRRRAVSDHRSGNDSERDSAWSSAGSSVYTMSANSLGTTYTISSLDGRLPTLSRRWSQSSDNIPPNTRMADNSHLLHSESFDDQYLVDGEQNASLFPPVRRKWTSQESFTESSQQEQQQQAQVALNPRSHSPSSLLADGAIKSSDEPSVLPTPPAPRRKWSEQGNFDPGAVALGGAQGINQSSEKDSPFPSMERATAEQDPSPDPLVNPKVVTSRPTPRQDRILQQLSTLRQGLLQKQREIETLVRHPASWPS